MDENKDLIDVGEVETLIGDVDLAPDIDEYRELSDEDLQQTIVEESEE